MKLNTCTEEPRYSFKTLRALYDGSTSLIKLLVTDSNADLSATAYLLYAGDDGLLVQKSDGTLQHDIDLRRILHAEVI